MLAPLTFHQNQVAASQTDFQLVTIETDDATTVSTTLTTGYIVPFPGEIVAVSFLLNAAGTTGVFTIGASVGGTEDADTTITVGTDASASKLVARGLGVFAADAEIGVEITTDGSWDGITSDLVVVVWVLLQPEGI